MKFQFEKLGALEKKTEIELGDLTILCGANNTGKTYLTRAINGFLKTWANQIDFKIAEDKIQSLLQNGVLKIDLSSLEKDIPEVLDELSKKYTASLPTLFNASEDFFSETLFQALLDDNYQPNYQKELQISAGTKAKEVLTVYKDKDCHILDFALLAEDKNLIPHLTVIKKFINKAISQALLGEYFANPFMFTSERTSTEGKDFVRDIIEVHSKKKSALIKKHPEIVKWLRNIVGGEFQVENNQIFFAYQKGHKIPLYLASATAASQVEIDFYLKCLAKRGDILLIDEPEQNLHLANQRKMARLFVGLIKAGVKVFVTTHSDYIIKELNNLIILGSEFDDKNQIMTKYTYTEDEKLEISKVKVYSVDKQVLVPAPINELGIVVSSFDREIIEMNDMFDDMTMTMEIAYE
jgi:ABC-type transport system involved in cytochrome c biogenesis ATPase subunit